MTAEEMGEACALIVEDYRDRILRVQSDEPAVWERQAYTGRVLKEIAAEIRAASAR